jgi:hypothetical protein
MNEEKTAGLQRLRRDGSRQALGWLGAKLLPRAEERLHTPADKFVNSRPSKAGTHPKVGQGRRAIQPPEMPRWYLLSANIEERRYVACYSRVRVQRKISARLIETGEIRFVGICEPLRLHFEELR